MGQCRCSHHRANRSPRPPALPACCCRNDLRTSDHEPLHAAASSRPTALLPVYCLDPRDLQPRRLLPGGSQAGTAEGAAAGSANNRESNSSGGGDDGPSRGSSGSAGAALGVPKLGPFRLRALLEALSGLDRELQGCGSRLAFHQGKCIAFDGLQFI